MKKVVKFLGLFLCMGTFTLFALGSGSSGDKNNSEKVGEVETKQDEKKDSSSENGESKTEETEETTKDSELSEYHVGDVLTYKGLSITYVSSSDYVSDNDFMQPADGNKYIRLELYAENNSGSDKSVTSFEFKCYADGYECESKYFDDDISLSLSDGRTGTGAIYFEVPQNASDIEIEYELDWLSEKKAIFIFDGNKDSGFVANTEVTESADAYKVGDIIENGSLRISYLKAAEYESDNAFLQPKEGNKYIYIELEVENISDSDKAISFYSFECYADGAHCEGYYGMDDALSATLSAGRKAKGTIAFEVPKNANTIEIEFEDNIWTSSKIIFKYE